MLKIERIYLADDERRLERVLDISEDWLVANCLGEPEADTAPPVLFMNRDSTAGARARQQGAEARGDHGDAVIRDAASWGSAA
jgi:hypothetical protein